MEGLGIYCFCVSIILLFNSRGFSVSAQEGNGNVDVCKADLSSFLPVPFNNVTGFNCHPVWNNFVLRFSRANDNVVTIILSAAYTSGWVGMGFSKDGMMLGSSAMVGWMGSEGQPHIKQYYLQGFNPSAVIPDKGELQLTNIPPAVVLNGATIYLAFQLTLQNPPKSKPIILAFGTKTPPHKHLSAHEDKTTVVIDFSQGSRSGDANYKSFQSSMLLKRSHGVLAIIGWGVLLPAGAIVARYFRHRDPLWFYLHTSIQFIGFVIGFAAAVAGKELYGRIHADLPTHKNIGIVVLVLSILQIKAFFFRPDKDAKIRRYWNWYHHWFGRFALFLAAINILIGIQAAGGIISWRVVYGFILTAILVTVIVMETLLRLRKHSDKPIFQMNSS